jgi:hypothetical protein
MLRLSGEKAGNIKVKLRSVSTPVVSQCGSCALLLLLQVVMVMIRRGMPRHRARSAYL